MGFLYRSTASYNTHICFIYVEQLNVSPPTTTKNQGNQTQFTRNDDNWVFIDKIFIQSSFRNYTYILMVLES